VAWFGDFIKAVWESRIVRFLRSVCDDLVRGAAILLGMEALWWIIKRMELMGYPPEELQYFQRVHFACSIVAFVLVCLNFVIKLAIGYYQESQHD